MQAFPKTTKVQSIYNQLKDYHKIQIWPSKIGTNNYYFTYVKQKSSRNKIFSACQFILVEHKDLSCQLIIARQTNGFPLFEEIEPKTEQTLKSEQMTKIAVQNQTIEIYIGKDHNPFWTLSFYNTTPANRWAQILRKLINRDKSKLSPLKDLFPGIDDLNIANKYKQICQNDQLQEKSYSSTNYKGSSSTETSNKQTKEKFSFFGGKKKQQQEKENLQKMVDKLKYQLEQQKQFQNQCSVLAAQQANRNEKKKNKEINDIVQQKEKVFNALKQEFEEVKSENQANKKLVLKQTQKVQCLEKELKQKAAELQEKTLMSKRQQVQFQEKLQECRLLQQANKQRIQELQKIIQQAKETQECLRKEVQQCKLQNELMKKQLKQLEEEKTKLQSLEQKITHLQYQQFFQGTILADQHDHKMFLFSALQEFKQHKIVKTSRIFTFDPLNKTSFHKYIDEVPDLAVLIKTQKGYFLAGFSESPFSSTNSASKGGLILSLTNHKGYSLMEGKRSITYDNYFLIVGNSEIRWKEQETKCFCNFGIPNGYYDTKGDKVNDLLGEGTEREVPITAVEVHKVTFEE